MRPQWRSPSHNFITIKAPGSPIEVGDGQALGVFLGVASQKVGDVLPGGGADEATRWDADHGSVAGTMPAAPQRQNVALQQERW